jgi:hypothetical protein
MAIVLLLPLLAGPAQADGDQKKILKLIEQMNDDSPEVRVRASISLAEIGRPALEALKKAAHEHQAPGVRERAEQAVLSIYQRDLRKDTEMWSGMFPLDRGGRAVLVIGETGLPVIVIPRGRYKAQTIDKGEIQITSVEGGVETKILYTVSQIQVTLGGKVFSTFDEKDLKAKHPEAYAALAGICPVPPLNFAQAQVIINSSRPPNQSVEDYVTDLQKSYESLIELIRGSSLAADLSGALVTELERVRDRRVEQARK